MADALADRRQKLYDERTTLETIRSCIHGKLALPSDAEKYITTQLGQDGKSAMCSVLSDVRKTGA